jgi:hypothetical protein
MDQFKGGESLGLHPVTERVMKTTESGELKREHSFYGKKVWKLLNGENVEIGEADGFSMKITIDSLGNGKILDQESNLDLSISNWSVEGGAAGFSVENVLKNLKDVFEFIKRVGNKVPSGNLEDMGGLVGLADSYMDVKNAEAYYSNNTVDPHRESMGSVDNIPKV